MDNIADDFFNIEQNGPTPKDTEPFIIDSEDRVNWFLAKAATIRAEQARVKSQAEKRVAELDTVYNSLTTRFMPQVEAWGTNEVVRRKRKTLTLLQGTIKVTSYAPKPIITSYEDAMQTALLIAPAAIVTEEIPEVPAVPARTETKLDDKALFAAFLAATVGATNEDGSPLTLPGLGMSEARETVKIVFGKEEPEAN